MAVETMETFLTNIGAFFTQAIAWVGQLIETIVSNPALLIVVFAMPIVGFAVGLLCRLKKM